MPVRERRGLTLATGADREDDDWPQGSLRGSASFVGRKPQLAWLGNRLEEPFAGRPSVVLLEGEPGIGKTRLLRELRALAVRRGMEVSYGRCQEATTIPYLAFRPLLAELATGAPITTGTGNQLLLSDRGPVPLLDVTAAILSRASQRPLAILIDDLHAADSGSFDLLSHLVFEMADALPSRRMPILLVCATRPIGSDHPLYRGLARITREEICERIELTGLGENEVYELIEGMGLARPSHQLVGAVSRATGANPLFVQEVVRHLVREGAVANRGGASTL